MIVGVVIVRFSSERFVYEGSSRSFGNWNGKDDEHKITRDKALR